jgi:sortase A
MARTDQPQYNYSNIDRGNNQRLSSDNSQLNQSQNQAYIARPTTQIQNQQTNLEGVSTAPNQQASVIAPIQQNNPNIQTEESQILKPVTGAPISNNPNGTIVATDLPDYSQLDEQANLVSKVQAAYQNSYQKYYQQIALYIQKQQDFYQKQVEDLASKNKILVESGLKAKSPEHFRRDLLGRLIALSEESRFIGKLKVHLKALSFATMIGLVVLFIQFNPIIVGALKSKISPANNSKLPTIIEPTSSENIGPDPKIIIPRIGVNAPVIYDIPEAENDPVQKGLERGTVRYANTSSPGQSGNTVILGHSSSNIFSPGEYKYIFVKLKELEVDDVIYLHYEGKRYAYKVVIAKKIVKPEDFTYIAPTEKPSVTLITCDPPGTNKNRLVVQAVQISPDPSTNEQATPLINTEGTTPTEVPSSAPSFWDRIF